MIQNKQQNPFDELAALLSANGIQPQRNDSNDEYVARIEAWNKRKKYLNGKELDVIKKNAAIIRKQIEKMIKVRTGMMALGQAGKWMYTLIACINKAGNWGQLVKATAAYSPGQLAAYSFGRTIASRSMWIITAGLTAVQISLEFKSWHSGQITGKQFWVNVGKKIIVNGASVAGGACGAYAGAAIGMCFGPIGGIVGAILGGIVGSVSTAYATEKILESFDENYAEYTSTKLLFEALDFYDLPKDYDMGLLQKAKVSKTALYHPDKWSSESQERQRTIAEKYSKSMTYYEILKSAIEVRDSPNVELQQLP